MPNDHHTGPNPDHIQRWIENQADYGGPLIPLDRMDNALEAMGVALFHIGSAALDYSLIMDRHPGGATQEQLEERYCNAENNARIAHSVLHLVYSELADRHPLNLAPEMRKYCRKAHTWLTQERRKAAEAIGITPPPQEDESVAFDALDHVYDPMEDKDTPGAPSPREREWRDRRRREILSPPGPMLEGQIRKIMEGMTQGSDPSE